MDAGPPCLQDLLRLLVDLFDGVLGNRVIGFLDDLQDGGLDDLVV